MWTTTGVANTWEQAIQNIIENSNGKCKFYKYQDYSGHQTLFVWFQCKNEFYHCEYHADNNGWNHIEPIERTIQYLFADAWVKEEETIPQIVDRILGWNQRGWISVGQKNWLNDFQSYIAMCVENRDISDYNNINDYEQKNRFFYFNDAYNI